MFNQYFSCLSKEQDEQRKLQWEAAREQDDKTAEEGPSRSEDEVLAATDKDIVGLLTSEAPTVN